jgi:PAS domain-containing protein
MLSRPECAERVRLTDQYCRAITEFNRRREALARSPVGQDQEAWVAADTARIQSQAAWDRVAAHIAAHRCLSMSWTGSPGGALEAAAMHAPDAILVADDDRRYIDVNEAAALVLGLPRDEIIGHRVDEFFREARGEPIPGAWEAFLEDGVQAGICETITPVRRQFAYRARANFAPGFHLSVLREVE